METREFEHAMTAWRARDFDKAASLAQTCLQFATSDDERHDCLLLLADARDELHDYEAALIALKSVLELRHDSVRAWNNLGVLCQKIGRLEEAREALENAYRLDPENASILISLASVCLKQSDPGTALTLIDLALEFAPAHPLAHANRSIILAIFGRLEEAEESLRLAVLYGFSNADPILERLEKLKEHRDKILSETLADQGEIPTPDEEIS